MAYHSVHPDARQAADTKPAATPGHVNLSSLTLLLLTGGMLAGSVDFAKAAPAFGWDPLSLLMWSFFLATVLQTAVFLRQGPASLMGGLSLKGQGGKTRLLIYMFVTGLLIAAPNAIAFASAKHVGVTFVTLTFAFPLVLTYGLSLMIGLEHPRLARVIGVLFSLAGGGVFAFGAGATNPSAGWWVLIAFSIPVFLTIGNLYRSMRWPPGASPQLLSIGMMAFSFASLLVLVAGMGVPLLPEHISVAAIAILLAQGAMYAVLYLFYFQLQKQAGPVYLSQLGSVSAAFGLPFGLIFFGEIPSLVQVAALFLIVLGIFLVSRRRNRAAAGTS
ncbi:DMT family transporter [Roseibium sp. RKSG952]|uniref:DMT family transporter n=1 Tax=Roseibium sp. RKSG952 TaxID=2529384 RepID=UPI0012BC78A2|nr:DMT family transporter [Roseibium sp. RKSG952]MTH97045.1 DMT family transporter [Roseibium sp. RKSG952]